MEFSGHEFESFSFITAAQQALDEGGQNFSDVTTWLSALSLDPANTMQILDGDRWADERLYFTNDIGGKHRKR